MNLHLVTLLGLDGFRLVVTTDAVSIYTVLEELATISLVAQDGEVHFEVTGIPASDTTDVPSVSGTTGGDDVFTHLAVEHHGFIPNGRYGTDEVGTFLFAFVIARGCRKAC